MSLNVKYLPYAESAIALVKTVPGDYGDLASVTPKIQIQTTEGSELLAETSTGVAVYAGTTLNAAVVRGDTTCSVVDATAPALTRGRWYRVRDAAGDVVSDFELEDWTVSGANRLLQVRERFKEAHANAAVLTGRYITYTLDASTVATWANLYECVITWSNLGAVGGKMTDLRTIRKKIVQFGGLEAMWQREFPNMVDLIPGAAFEGYVDAAHREWRRRFFARDRSFDALIEIRDVCDLMLVEIARRACRGKMELAEMQRSLAQEGDRIFEEFAGSSFWTDDNDDTIRDGSEYQKGAFPPPRRFR